MMDLWPPVSRPTPICCSKMLVMISDAFYLGVSGSGKSMAMKSTIENVALATNDDIIIIDAEREYGGTVAVKLFLSFCRCCQRVMSVSIPRIRP